MGQKIKPDSLRLGITKKWFSNWFAKKFKFQPLLEEDILLRDEINKKAATSGIDSIIIDKAAGNYRITISSSRPGLIIGRGGKGVEDLTKLLESKLKNLRKKRGDSENFSLSLNIEELKRSEVSAKVVSQNIAWDLEKRFPFRRTIKKYLDQVFQNKEVEGAKINVSGRLDGGEIARSEHLERGKLPLQTIRANIDYGESTAFTIYGTVGIKVWIYKGDIFKENESL